MSKEKELKDLSWDELLEATSQKQTQIEQMRMIQPIGARLGGIAVNAQGKVNYKKWQQAGAKVGCYAGGKVRKERREKQWLAILNDLPKEFTSLELKDVCSKHGIKGSTFKLFKRKCKSIELVKQGSNQFNPSIYKKLDKRDLSFGDYNCYKKRT